MSDSRAISAVSASTLGRVHDNQLDAVLLCGLQHLGDARRRAFHQPAECAAYAMRRSESWLRDHTDELDGFPRPDGKLGVFSTEAVEVWVRRRFGLASNNGTAKDVEAELLGKLRGGKPQDPIPRRAAS
jgi:hypothetical protein